MGCSGSAAGSDAVAKGKLTLGYWNFRGGLRGSGTRYLLQYVGAKYDQTNYVPGSSQTTGEWPEAKKTLGMTHPNLPYITRGNFKLSETFAVQQYICQKYQPELLGTTPQERARVYQLQCIITDLNMKAMMTCFTQDNPIVSAEAFAEGLGTIAGILKDNKYITGDKLCLVDFYVFEFCNYSIRLDEDGIFITYPNLEAHHVRMRELPALKKFLDSEPDVLEKFLPPMAQIQI